MGERVHDRSGEALIYRYCPHCTENSARTHRIAYRLIYPVLRKEMIIDACGVNHFTWITEANYNGTDMLKILPQFIDKFYDKGYCEQTDDPDGFHDNPFLYGNKVKMDLFKRFGVLALRSTETPAREKPRDSTRKPLFRGKRRTEFSCMPSSDLSN